MEETGVGLLVAQALDENEVPPHLSTTARSAGAARPGARLASGREDDRGEIAHEHRLDMPFEGAAALRPPRVDQRLAPGDHGVGVTPRTGVSPGSASPRRKV
jgi:hypothetical protein